MKPESTSSWDYLALLLWAVFFAGGLVPEMIFVVARDAANVSARSALVNSSSVITLAFSVYIAMFAFRRCRELGLDLGEAYGRSAQIALMGLAAFLEIPGRGSSLETHTLLHIVIRFQDIPDQSLRNMVLFIGVFKLAAWWYLFSLILRYHAFGMRDVFGRMPAFLPSARRTRSTGQRRLPEQSKSDASASRPVPDSTHAE